MIDAFILLKDLLLTVGFLQNDTQKIKNKTLKKYTLTKF